MLKSPPADWCCASSGEAGPSAAPSPAPSRASARRIEGCVPRPSRILLRVVEVRGGPPDCRDPPATLIVRERGHSGNGAATVTCRLLRCACVLLC